MDITIETSNNVQIGLSQDNPAISVKKPGQIGFDVSKKEVNLSPKKSHGPAFEFVQKVVAGANVVRCTLEQFQALPSLDGKTWYAVTTTQDELRYLYLGATLIAQASQDEGTWGFAYTFPMIFGR